MGKVAKSQVFSSLVCVGVLVPCLAFTCFFGFGHFPFIITIPILVLSTAFLVTFLKKQKQNACVDENSVQEENPICDPTRKFVEREHEEGPELVIADVSPNIEGAPENEVVDLINESEDYPSESESIDDSVSSENFELDWMRCNSVGVQNEVISSTDSVSEEEEEEEDDDDDDDDDDSLIEIAIPGSGSTCNCLSEEPKQKLHSNLPESFIRQQGLMELLTDTNELINEEENLIEIDISMGSIKSSRFEIEA